MRDFFIKRFHKRKAVKVLLINRDKRQLTKYFVPDSEGNFTWYGDTFKIDQEPYYDTKGYPTYIFKYNNTGPINANPFIQDVEPSYMTAAEYNTAIHNKLAQELFNSADNKMDASNINVFISVANMIILLAVGYLLYNELETILDIIRTLERWG